MKKITTYKYRKNIGNRKAVYKQSWSNCWIYAVLNNLFINTWIMVSEQKFMQTLVSKKINIWRWNDTMVAWDVIIWLQEWLWFYEIDAIKHKKLFENMIKEWYSFIIKRWVKWKYHATNISLINWRVVENATKNTIDYWSLEILYDLIGCGYIQSNLRFLDTKQQ